MARSQSSARVSGPGWPCLACRATACARPGTLCATAGLSAARGHRQAKFAGARRRFRAIRFGCQIGWLREVARARGWQGARALCALWGFLANYRRAIGASGAYTPRRRAALGPITAQGGASRGVTSATKMDSLRFGGGWMCLASLRPLARKPRPPSGSFAILELCRSPPRPRQLRGAVVVLALHFAFFGCG